MRILALESSAKAASAAISEEGRLICQYFQSSGLTHSRTLLYMAESMLKNLDITMGDIDAIAVANGPGSFTGIRIGAAAAKGLAWGAEKPVIGVSTLEAMAYHLADREGVVICPVMDARRDQVYNAKFIARGGELERLCPDRAISVEQLISEAEADEKTYFLVGDGAEMCYNILSERIADVRLVPETLRLQSAYGVAMAA
ncbi:MAG: tRNA (adenosine(37)-N6)-threonylcarbamoyltransferase complex dimerization subunit type 1 TsaB, partial [Oscillospiraceae bacterium]|nr:tRNA (adenosine(37)-N6)-threonylcarbamoyltransferase complex dimerization subunit type 1 TsaB [Oscillospiraceae bacterium]